MGASSSSQGTTATNQAQNSLAAMQYGTQTGSNQQQNQATASSSATGPSALAQQYMANGAAPVSASDIQNYENPYQNNVINSTMSQLGQSQAAQTAQNAGNAITGGALGGGRDAMSRALLGGQQNLATGATLAGLNANNYTQGLTAAQQDNARQMQAASMAGTQQEQQGVAQSTGQTLGTTAGSTASGSTSQGAGTGASQSQTTTNPGALALAGMGMSMMGGSAGGGGIHKEDQEALKSLRDMLNSYDKNPSSSKLADGGQTSQNSGNGVTGDSEFDNSYETFQQLLNKILKMNKDSAHVDPHSPHGSQQAQMDQYQKQQASRPSSEDYSTSESNDDSSSYDSGGTADDSNNDILSMEALTRSMTPPPLNLTQPANNPSTPSNQSSSGKSGGLGGGLGSLMGSGGGGDSGGEASGGSLRHLASGGGTPSITTPTLSGYQPLQLPSLQLPSITPASISAPSVTAPSLSSMLANIGTPGAGSFSVPMPSVPPAQVSGGGGGGSAGGGGIHGGLEHLMKVSNSNQKKSIDPTKLPESATNPDWSKFASGPQIPGFDDGGDVGDDNGFDYSSTIPGVSEGSPSGPTLREVSPGVFHNTAADVQPPLPEKPIAPISNLDNNVPLPIPSPFRENPVTPVTPTTTQDVTRQLGEYNTSLDQTLQKLQQKPITQYQEEQKQKALDNAFGKSPYATGNDAGDVLRSLPQPGQELNNSKNAPVVQPAAIQPVTVPSTSSFTGPAVPTGFGPVTEGKPVTTPQEQQQASIAPQGPRTQTQQQMDIIADELRKQGVPEENIQAATAHMHGQFQMESSNNPNTPHDNGNGFGLYGANGDRLARQNAYADAHGLPRNSYEAQARYAVEEAMTQPEYRQTADVLRNANPDNFNEDTRTITGNFERPKVINDRSSAVRNSYDAYGQGQKPPENQQPQTVIPARGQPVPNQDNRPSHYEGGIKVGNDEFSFGTGGGGRGSMPYGTYPISDDHHPYRNNDTIMLGDKEGNLDDPKYPGKPRSGMLIHPSDTGGTAGCLGIPREDWPEFRKAFDAKVAKEGPQVVKINEDGSASIEPASQQGTTGQTAKETGSNAVPMSQTDQFTQTMSEDLPKAVAAVRESTGPNARHYPVTSPQDHANYQALSGQGPMGGIGQILGRVFGGGYNPQGMNSGNRNQMVKLGAMMMALSGSPGGVAAAKIAMGDQGDNKQDQKDIASANSLAGNIIPGLTATKAGNDQWGHPTQVPDLEKRAEAQKLLALADTQTNGQFSRRYGSMIPQEYRTSLPGNQGIVSPTSSGTVIPSAPQTTTKPPTTSGNIPTPTSTPDEQTSVSTDLPDNTQKDSSGKEIPQFAPEIYDAHPDYRKPNENPKDYLARLSKIPDAAEAVQYAKQMLTGQIKYPSMMRNIDNASKYTNAPFIEGEKIALEAGGSGQDYDNINNNNNMGRNIQQRAIALATVSDHAILLNEKINHLPDAKMGMLSKYINEGADYYLHQSNDPEIRAIMHDINKISTESAKVDVGGMTSIQDRAEKGKLFDLSQGKQSLQRGIIETLDLARESADAIDGVRSSIVHSPFIKTQQTMSPSIQKKIDSMHKSYTDQYGAADTHPIGTGEAIAKAIPGKIGENISGAGQWLTGLGRFIPWKDGGHVRGYASGGSVESIVKKYTKPKSSNNIDVKSIIKKYA